MSGIKNKSSLDIPQRVDVLTDAVGKFVTQSYKLEAEVRELRELVHQLLLRPIYVPYPQPLQVHAPQPHQPYISPYATTTQAEAPFEPVDDGLFNEDVSPPTAPVEPAKLSPRATYYAGLVGKTQESDLV